MHDLPPVRDEIEALKERVAALEMLVAALIRRVPGAP
jgi:hypothetical protein